MTRRRPGAQPDFAAERAGLDAIQDRLAQPGPDLGSLVSDVRARLELTDGVWASG